MRMKITLKLFILMMFLLGSMDSYAGLTANSNNLKTTIILIRHAERDNFFILTEEGRIRAKDLIESVKDMEIDAIYSPDLERDLDTVTPLALHLGIDITVTPRISQPMVDKFIDDIISKHQGEVVLIVGNGSGYLRAVHQKLGGAGDGPYQYGDLFIYKILENGSMEITKSRYGR